MNKFGLILLINMTLLSSQTFTEAASIANRKLSATHEKIIKKYPEVKHITADDFVQLKVSQTLIFDVREPEEYAVSHLKNAIQINPNMKISKFLDAYSDELNHKTIVFYCSVGERSSKLAAKYKLSLEAQGAQEIYNLVGGIFQWHNEKRKLMEENTETSLIHPYNRFWGRLLDDKNAISYKPNPKTINKNIESN